MRSSELPARPFALLAWALRPSPGEFAVLIVTLLGVWLCELFIPFILGATVDAAVSRREPFTEIFRFGVSALIAAAALYLFHTFYLRAETRLVARGTFRLRSYLYTRIIEQPLSALSGSRKDEMAQRVMGDAGVLDAHAIYLFADVPFSILTILGVFAVMAWMQPGLALLVLAVLVSAAMLSHVIGHPLGTRERLVRHRWTRLGGRLQQTFDCFRSVKSCGREDHEARSLDREGDRLMRAEIASGEIVARLEPLLQLMTTFGFLAVVWYGAYLVHAGALTPGRLVAFIAYMELMREPVRDAGVHYAHYKQSAGILRRIADLVRRLSPRAFGGSFGPTGRLGVELTEIGFSWPGSGRRILDGVSFRAAPGEIVAIVGENGAGKSTLMDVLLGLLQADCGTVRIGGIALEEWNRTALRRVMAVVPQAAMLFHATIEENIRYGAPDAGEGELAAALKLSGLEPVIARLPRGIRTIVGDRGDRLSGGERQRVTLARALLLKPQILVLDEAASGLDAEILPSLLKLLQEGRDDRLTFVVSHHREIVSIADRVIVLDHGRLTCICTPSELDAQRRAAA
jgi:ABC-type multidrug transport system fused ATPase/permease subunit